MTQGRRILQSVSSSTRYRSISRRISNLSPIQQSLWLDSFLRHFSERLVAVQWRLVAVQWGSMRDAVVQPAMSLEGGFLKRPTLLPTRTCQGRAFVQVARRNAALMRFLTGKHAKLSPTKDSSLFGKLLSLRNDATRAMGKLADTPPDDLGLDDEVSTQLSVRRRREASQRESDIPMSILEVHIEGKVLSVLSGRCREPVYMEATSQNMSTLFALFSTEDQERLDQVAAAPPFHALEPHDMEEEDSASSEGQAEDDGPPSEQVRGLTWVPKRRAWILRYEDDMGKKRQKRFGAKERNRAGQAAALRWFRENRMSMAGA